MTNTHFSSPILWFVEVQSDYASNEKQYTAELDKMHPLKG